jgi:hypothetical protein
VKHSCKKFTLIDERFKERVNKVGLRESTHQGFIRPLLSNRVENLFAKNSEVQVFGQYLKKTKRGMMQELLTKKMRSIK